MTGLEYLALHRETFRKLCRRYGAQHEDDLWDVIVDHIDRIYGLWDPSFNVPRKQYMIDSLRRYMYKWVAKEGKRVARLKPLYDEHATHTIFELDTTEAVQTILERVSLHDRKLLVLHEVAGKSFSEIAKLLGCSVGTAHGHYTAALRRIQSRADK